jgi:hypothetical protein
MSSQGSYYLDYDVSLNGAPITEAFCVENSDGPGYGVPTTYTLLSIDSGLSAFGLDSTRYLAASWVANNYGNDSSADTRAAAQIAVWEIIFDYGTINLGSGSFTSSTYVTEANAILSALAGQSSLPATGGSWVLAVNPPIISGDVDSVKYQNYLVQHVPEPGLLLLLGIGVGAIAGIYRISKP